MRGDTSPEASASLLPQEWRKRLTDGSLVWRLGLTLWLLGSIPLLLTAWFGFTGLTETVAEARRTQAAAFAYTLIRRLQEQPEQSSRELYPWLLRVAPAQSYRYVGLSYADNYIRSGPEVVTLPGETLVNWGQRHPQDDVVTLTLPYAGAYNLLRLELRFDPLLATVGSLLLWRLGLLLLVWGGWTLALTVLMRVFLAVPLSSLLMDLRLQRENSETLRLSVDPEAQDEFSVLRRLCNGIWERLLLQQQRLLDTVSRLQYASVHLEQLARQRTQTLEQVANNLLRNEAWLNAFAAIASSSLTVTNRVHELLALACRCTEMDVACITIQNAQAIKAIASYPPNARLMASDELPYASELYAEAQRQRGLISYLRLSQSPWGGQTPEAADTAYLGLPLQLPRQVMLGTLHLFRRGGRATPFDPDALNLVKLCASALGNVLLRDWHEQMLFQAKERAQVTLASIGDAVFVTNAHGQLDYLNPAAEQLIEWEADRAQRQDIRAILPLVDAKGQLLAVHPVHQCLETRKVIRIQDCFLRSPASVTALLAVEGTTAPIRNRHSVVEGTVVVIADVSAERELMRQLHFQARHDALTGLVNRREFEQRLGQVLEAPDGTAHALCYLDLDQFKLVNDTCGHAVGDELLRQLAYIIQKQLHAGDTLARLGGDEFGLLLLNCSKEQAVARAEQFRDVISEFRFGWQGRTFSVGVSIGLVMLGDAQRDLARALSAADSACYAAKGQGRNRVHVFQPDDLELARRQGEMQWVMRIKQALQEERFVLYHQPIFPLAHDRSPRHRHSEILLRMQDEDGSIVLPGAFIGAAERYDLMYSIDRWVIDNVFSAVREWLQRDSLWLNRCSINLSGSSMGEPDLGPFIQARLKEYQLPPELFCFEITETSAIANLRLARSLIDSLKQIGCAFSLDDFGSGLSSFGYLKNLPVDYLKIDGAFIRDMSNDPIDYAMVRSINEVGHLMNLKTVAEFVQTQEVLEMLRDIHVDYAQGYWLAKPKPFTMLNQL